MWPKHLHLHLYRLTYTYINSPLSSSTHALLGKGSFHISPALIGQSLHIHINPSLIEISLHIHIYSGLIGLDLLRSQQTRPHRAETQRFHIRINRSLIGRAPTFYDFHQARPHWVEPLHPHKVRTYWAMLRYTPVLLALCTDLMKV